MVTCFGMFLGRRVWGEVIGEEADGSQTDGSEGHRERLDAEG